LGANVWKSSAGRVRLNDWYDHFRDKIDVSTESIFVDTRHGPSHVLIAGPEDAPPLVCLHAMRTGSSFLLSELGPVLDRYRVLAPDLPGQSIRGPEVRFSLNDDSLALWLVEMMDALGLEHVNLFGVSWGGFLARLMATTAPDRVRRLMLMVPAGIANGSHLTGLMKMAVPMMRYRIRPTKDNLKKLLSPILTTWDDGWAESIAGTIRDMKIDVRIPPLASDEALCKLAMPTLVLAADQDISFPGHLIERRLSKVSPNIEIEIMQDCKHCPPTTTEFRIWLGDRLSRFIEA